MSPTGGETAEQKGVHQLERGSVDTGTPRRMMRLAVDGKTTTEETETGLRTMLWIEQEIQSAIEEDTLDPAHEIVETVENVAGQDHHRPKSEDHGLARP